MSFEEELNNIRPYSALCCLPGCSNMQFIPFEDVKKVTLKKYKINETQYRQIQKKLDCLSFGCCGWCS